jgi:hypothetical protein
MTEFSENYLKNLAANKVQGDFTPFSKGDIGKVKRYIKGMLGRLSDDKRIVVLPDYQAYGSGFASYINVKVSKKDRSDVRVIKDGKRTIDDHDGLLLYISLLSPHWYFGKGSWWDNYSDGSYKGGGGSFLTSRSIREFNKPLWENDVMRIVALFTEFGYELLSENEVEKSLWFDTKIETNLSDAPFTVFDCFFHWED